MVKLSFTFEIAHTFKILVTRITLQNELRVPILKLTF